MPARAQAATAALRRPKGRGAVKIDAPIFSPRFAYLPDIGRQEVEARQCGEFEVRPLVGPGEAANFKF
jgi:hypothetical protein